jgi:predicted GNAT superfamily acetyltransferase
MSVEHQQMSTFETHDEPAPPPSLGLPDGLEIRLLGQAEEMVDVVHVFQQVWGSVSELVGLEMLMAIAHAGGYVGAAYDVSGTGADRILGASVGILARHNGQRALHSHITGLLPGARRLGLGRAMKLHQQAWARDNGIEWIVWTFDPLVRRNAWFNVAVLGAEVHEYLESFYGTMTDAINAGDESDRLLLAWNVDTDPDAEPRDGRGVTAARLIPTPEDVVALRRTDPAAVQQWRADTRQAFTTAFADHLHVLGFTREGDYVIGGDP